ncbi:MAG: putative colanic acid biosynthesis acetyltransferase [Verrucomicrobia bacterium]|nr:putative colanic acid biosynthesis acetyltransferase [Verrucomicrobiota bacterium]
MPGEPPYLGQNCVSPFSRRELILRTLWHAVQVTLFRWSPRPCHGFRARLLRLFGANIIAPSQVVVFPTAKIFLPWKLTLAPRSMVGREVVIYNLAPVSLDYGANLSQRTHLCAGTHDYLRWSMPMVARPIVIGRNAWLGAEVFVGPGVTIGELAVIGARSVVIKDQPARMICAGQPCRPLKPRPEPQ